MKTIDNISFKVMTGTLERNKAIQEKLFEKGGKCRNKTIEEQLKTAVPFALFFNNPIFEKGLAWVSNIESFIQSYEIPEMTFQQVLNLLDSLPPRKEFDITPFDRVLVRLFGSNKWRADFYSDIGVADFLFVGGRCNMVIKYEGNERFLGTPNTPEEWWEVENNKPVLKRKVDTPA